MKSDKLKYRILGSFGILIILGFSIAFLFIGKHYDFQETSLAYRVEGNTAYWVFKGIGFGWVGIILIGIWFGKHNFSKYAPLTIGAIAASIIPAFMRIGYNPCRPILEFEQGLDHPYIALIIIFAFILSLLLGFAGLYAVSHGTMTRAEDAAGHSSNYKG